MLTGVCAGLGRYTGMDPVIFRVGFAVLVVGSGIGIMLYVAAFLLMRNTQGGPGYAEQWSRRVFDTETVMALLAAIFAFGLIINLAADGISTSTVVVGTLLAIALLAAHARGVDLLALVKSMPERVKGKRGTRPVPEHWTAFPSATRAFSHAPGTPGGTPAASAFTTAAAPSAPPFASDAPPATTSAFDAHPSDAPPATTSAFDAPPSDAPAEAPSDAPSASEAPPGDRIFGTSAAAGRSPAAEQLYRRLSDLAKEARAAATAAAGPGAAPPPAPGYRQTPRPGGFDSSGEPFAPHGPYSPRRPYEPDDWEYGRRPSAAAARPPRPKRPKSFTGAITVFVAFLVGGIMVATQSPSAQTVNLPLIGGAVLITIGAGLLVATWFGRGAGLVATGTIVSLLLVAGSTVNGIPKKIGSYTWEPVDSSVAVRTYSVGIGDGTLDLRDTKFLPGSRTRFDASVSMGELKIIVPSYARVEVFGYARLGDVKIEHAVQGGTDVHHDKVLEPAVSGTGAVPVIELHVKAGIGDVEVRRAA